MLFCHFSDEIIEINVETGENITLETNETKQQPPKKIFWSQGVIHHGLRIAQSVDFIVTLYKDNMYLDPQTGDLTIYNVSLNHTGRYWVELIWKDESSAVKQYKMNVHGKCCCTSCWALYVFWCL